MKQIENKFNVRTKKPKSVFEHTLNATIKRFSDTWGINKLNYVRNHYTVHQPIRKGRYSKNRGRYRNFNMYKIRIGTETYKIIKAPL